MSQQPPWVQHLDDALAGRHPLPHCQSVYPPSADAPHNGSGWSAPVRCTLSEGHGQVISPLVPAVHWNTGIHWEDSAPAVTSSAVKPRAVLTSGVDVSSTPVYGVLMPSRDVLSVRVSPAGLERIDKLATDTATDRSNVARALLAEALASPRVIAEATARLRSAL
jgi:hypothetical protein